MKTQTHTHTHTHFNTVKLKVLTTFLQIHFIHTLYNRRNVTSSLALPIIYIHRYHTLQPRLATLEHYRKFHTKTLAKYFTRSVKRKLRRILREGRVGILDAICYIHFYRKWWKISVKCCTNNRKHQWNVIDDGELLVECPTTNYGKYRWNVSPIMGNINKMFHWWREASAEKFNWTNLVKPHWEIKTKLSHICEFLSTCFANNVHSGPQIFK